MILDNYAAAIRDNVRRAAGSHAWQPADVLRPTDDGPFGADTLNKVGSVRGYRYTKRGSTDAIRLGIPGELADSFDGEWLMVLDEDGATRCTVGDVLDFAGTDRRKVESARDGTAGVYRIYRLAEVTA